MILAVLPQRKIVALNYYEGCFKFSFFLIFLSKIKKKYENMKNRIKNTCPGGSFAGKLIKF